MAFLGLNYFSKALTQTVSVNVILPGRDEEYRLEAGEYEIRYCREKMKN